MDLNSFRDTKIICRCLNQPLNESFELSTVDTLKIKAARISETSAFYHNTIWHHNQEDLDFNP